MNTPSLGLSESPASVLSELYPRSPAQRKKKELSLQEFVDMLPETIDKNKSSTSPEDLIGQLME
jgi:hypothetical protein